MRAAWIQSPFMTEQERSLLAPLLSQQDEIIQNFGFSGLHQAVLGIKPKSFLDSFPAVSSMPDAADVFGWTPLHWAAHNGDADALGRLIKLGCTVDARSGRNETPLHIASEAGSVECAEILLEAGAYVSAISSGSRTPLYYGAKSRRRSVSILELLIQHGAQVTEKSSISRTPLLVGYDKDDVVRLLLRHGACVDDRDNGGWTVIMRAIRIGAAKSVALLLEAGADTSPVDNSGKNILHHAAIGANLATLKCLSTADLKGVDTDLLDKDGDTPSELFQSGRRLVSVDDEKEKEEERAVFEALTEKARALWKRRGGSSSSDEDSRSEEAFRSDEEAQSEEEEFQSAEEEQSGE